MIGLYRWIRDRIVWRAADWILDHGYSEHLTAVTIIAATLALVLVVMALTA